MKKLSKQAFDDRTCGRPLHIGAQNWKEKIITHQSGELLQPQIAFAAAMLVAGMSGNALGKQPEALTILAQTQAPASIFNPWSEDDVRQGAGTRSSAPRAPAATIAPAGKLEVMPKDARRSSAPTDDAIPIFRRSNRSDLEDIRTGSRPEAQRKESGDSFITLQPFSDGDIRSGSRRQPGAAPQPAGVSEKPKAQAPDKENKGFFGRVLEKVGF